MNAILIHNLSCKTVRVAWVTRELTRKWENWADDLPNSIIHVEKAQGLELWSAHTRVCVLCRFSCVWLFAMLWTEPAGLLLGFSRQEYWSGCHFLLQGIFPTQGSNPHLVCLLHWQAFFTTRATWEDHTAQQILCILRFIKENEVT